MKNKIVLSTVAISAATPAAAATITPTAPATAPAAIAAPAAGRPFLARTRLINRQSAALKFFSVELGDRRVRF